MGFADVDHQEPDTLVIMCIQAVETDRPFDKGRSGETAKNERYWLVTPEIGQTHRIFADRVVQLKIWGEIANFGRSGIIAALPGTERFYVIDCSGQAISPLLSYRRISIRIDIIP